MKHIGIVGLGNMGRGMALSLARASFIVHGHDASIPAMQALADQGIAPEDSLPALLSKVDMLILSLPDSPAVEAVALGPSGIAAHAPAGLLVMDASTSDPDSTRKVAAALAEKGVRFIDAPVSGGPKAAHSGTMTMLLGGSSADIGHAMPVLEVLSRRRVHVGPVGAGHVAKLLNNLLCGAQLLLAGEAARMAAAAGLDAERIFEGINAGSGRSAVSEINFPEWIFSRRFDSGFTMGLMRKDIGLAARLLDQLAVSAPMAAQTADIWKASRTELDDAQDFNRIVEFPAR